MKAAFHPQGSFPKNKVGSDGGSKVLTAPGVDIPELAPGEPVPPGFEDMVAQVPEIMSTLSEMKAPLIGLEYLAEITPVGEESEPKYCCLLCNKRGDPRTVLAHLVCFNHRIKYIGRYFPRVNTALALIPKVREYKRGTGEVLARIVKAIEATFGRLNPVIVDGLTFDAKKEEIYLEMASGRHFHETSDTNYESLVDIDFIKKCAPETDNILTIDLEKEEAKKRSNPAKNDVNLKPKGKNTTDQGKRSLDGSSYKPAQKKRREKSVETISTLSSNSRSRSRSRSWSRSRSVSRSRSWSGSRSRSRSRYRYMYRDYKRDEGRRSPRYYRRSRSRSRNNSSSYRSYRNSNYRSRPPPSRDSYRSIRYDSLYHDEDRYSERPKSTQLKVAELRDRRRKKDLYNDFVAKLERDMAKILKGYEKNPEKHPSYPEEWKKFWNRRYKELTAEGIDASKHDFKPEWIKFWTVRMKELHNEELRMKKEKYRSELGLPDTDSSGALDSDVIEVSPTPLEDDKSNITVEDIKNTWKVLTGGEIKGTNSAETSLSPEKSDDFELGSAEPEQPIRVITVLRLLTALESQLGSLGPRVNNLLAQAIALEKKREFSSDSLIDVSENNVLFETVKEKLKGQLFAGIVDKHMVKATRTAIQNVAELFNTWKAKKNNPEPTSAPLQIVPSQNIQMAAPVTDPLIVPGIGAVDKLAIAQQIASALVAQGKTNVTEQELEQLISAVVGMAQASSNQSQPSPTGSTQILPSSLSPGGISGLKLEQDIDMRQKRPSLLSDVGDKDNLPLKNLLNSDSSRGLNEVTCRRIFSKDLADLTEEDIKISLQNFKDLSSDEQQCLITYLKELESKDPASVEKLKKFLLLANDTSGKTDIKSKDDSSGRLSPFSMREGGANPFIDDKSRIHSRDLDEDEDDYSYEEIYKAAEKKLSGRSIVEQMIEEQQKKSRKQLEGSPKNEGFKSSESRYSKSNNDDPECVLSEAKVMIDNIMGQLPSKFTGGSTRMSAKSNTAKAHVDPPLDTQQMQHMYDNMPPCKPPENNLMNDYNYQDDLFGYSNDSYPQNYPVENEPPYRCPPNQEPAYGHPPEYEGYSKNVEQSYNNYEPWSDQYSQYPPPQMGNYDCQQLPPQSMPPGFNGPEVFQVPPNNFGGPVPPYGNNMYREYY
ncbi:UNVERIFIED_CONTAM: hypothetical protein PYX00_003027 [Menopon gallinae]